MRKCSLQYICAAASLTVGLGAASSASGVTVYTQSELAGSASDVQFVALVHQELHRPPTALMSVNLGNVPGGSHGSSFDVPGSFDSYAVFGRTSTGVFVSFSQAPYGVGESFENLFPGISESSLADALQQGGPLVDSFIDQLRQQTGNVTEMRLVCRTTHFSVGADFGTFQASFTPIPEPSGLAVLLVGGAITARRRR